MANVKKRRKTRARQSAAVIRARDEQRRFEVYRAIPAKDWEQMGGIHCRQRNDQARRYGIPFSGPLIDLTKVVAGLHEFFGKFGRELALLREGKKSGLSLADARRRRTEAEAALREIELGQKRGTLVDAVKADRRCLQLCRYFSGMLDRLPAEMSVKLAARGISEIETELEAWVISVRREMTAQPPDDRPRVPGQRQAPAARGGRSEGNEEPG